MDKYLILFTSITYANRAGEYLYTRGFRGRVIKTPAQYTNRSCGYSFSVTHGGDVYSAAQELDNIGLKYIKVVVVNNE